MERLPAVEVLYGVQELGFLGVVVVCVRGGHEVLCPDEFGRIGIFPEAVVGVVQHIGAVYIGTVYYCLGGVERPFPLVTAVCAAEDAALRLVGVVELLGCGNEGEAASEREDYIFVDASLCGFSLGGKHGIGLVQVFQDEVYAGVEV